MTAPVDPTIDPISEPPAEHPVGHAGARVDISEFRAWQVSGYLALLVSVAMVGVGVWQGVSSAIDGAAAGEPPVGRIVLAAVLLLLGTLVASSLVAIQPGQARVVELFGRYLGTARRTGLGWVMPFAMRRNVSVRVNNFETSALKVNDADGNPVEFAAIVVWQVADTAKAKYAVEDYENFVAVQAEAAVRHVASGHPYDNLNTEGTSLRGSTDVVSAELAVEVAHRVQVAGVEVIEVRVSHLAYAPEIAQAMLQRQQATAIVAAREQIVAGAVGMVELALARLEAEDIVVLDDERRAAMVSNLLVVLCGDQKATPIINAGTLYN